MALLLFGHLGGYDRDSEVATWLLPVPLDRSSSRQSWWTLGGSGAVINQARRYEARSLLLGLR